MGVGLRHLRAFAAIAEEGSITAAARRLSITQPALSRTLAQFERALGSRLVDRSTSYLTLSPDGRALLPQVLMALAAVDDVLEPVRGRSRPLRVGHAWSAAGPYTAAVLQEWARRQPDVPIRIRRLDDRYAGLTRGLVDLAFLRGHVEADGIEHEPLYTEPRVAVLPASHALASQASLSMPDLAGDGVVVDAVSEPVLENLWPSGTRPEVAARVDTLEDWLAQIAAGRGIGVTAASTAELHGRPDVAFVPLRDAPPMPVCLAWRQGQGHPARAAFRALAQDVVRSARTAARTATRTGRPAERIGPGPDGLSRWTPTIAAERSTEP